MKKAVYNKKVIMTKAWELAKATGKAFGECLKRAWADAKAIAKAIAVIGVETRTWFDWKKQGYEVIHGSKAVFQITVADPKTKSGERVISFFTKSQVGKLAIVEA